MKKEPALARLERYVFVEMNSGCWLWTASCFYNGYGQTTNDDGERVGAHRLSYELRVGRIPPGMMVCHKCDVRSCINPAHLFLGTAKDNQMDSAAKGRNTRGERHGASKLTSDAVRVIRDKISAGLKDGEIAKAFGVVPGCINLIRHGHSWRHV